MLFNLVWSWFVGFCVVFGGFGVVWLGCCGLVGFSVVQYGRAA